MRWFIILLIAVVLAGFAVYSNTERPAVRSNAATTTATSANSIGELVEGYTNKDLGFSMESPARAQAQHENFEGFLPLTATPVIAFTIPKDLFEGTNLGEAGVYVGATSSSKVLAVCTKPSKDTDEKAVGTSTINGVVWHMFSSKGVGAGNIYEEVVYRNVHGKYCYEITELLHSGNIANYPEGTVVPFDKAKFSGILESIAKTFAFTK